jgi:hypothetical protein
MARKHPQKDVWLLNTYAGVKMMKDAMKFQLELAKMEVPPFQPGDSTPQPPPPSEVGELDTNVQEFGDVDELSDGIVSALPNMFLHHVAYGEWDSQQLVATIDERERQVRGVHEPRVEGEKYNAKPGTVVIINSFEFATISRWARERLVRELIGLRESLGLTVIIFSQEMRRDMAAGLPGRGAIGYLAAKAGSVSRMSDPFEHLIRSRGGSNQRANGVIHEAQMQESAGGGSKKKKVIIEPDYLFSEFSRNPWMGETEREGGHLASLAKDIDLKMYYTAHKYDIFVRGQEPSSMAIKRGTYVQPQPVRTIPEPDIVRRLKALENRETV